MRQAQIKILIFFLILFLIIYFKSQLYFESSSIGQIVNEEPTKRVSDLKHGHKHNNSNKNGDNVDEKKPGSKTINDREYPFTIVTAASSNHFCAVQSWLYHMKGVIKSVPASKRPRIVLYDIGLANYQRKWIKVLYERKYMTELRRFEFEKYPAFWKIDNITGGEYGWKPGIISEIVRDYPGQIFWLDSGTFTTPEFLRRFSIILNYYDGFFSPSSLGYMPNWTHPGVFEYFHDDARNYKKRINCNGAAVAFDSNKARTLIDEWVKCARVKQCIAPKGSDRQNHRQDQAILTYLAAREKRFCVNRVEFFGLRTHMDRTCEKNIYFYEKLNGITWSPTKEDLIEMEEVKESSVDSYVYDIWNPGTEEKLLDKINEEDGEIFDYFFNLKGKGYLF